jgi:glycosyltransferase involved in cell wall biosynthesis
LIEGMACALVPVATRIGADLEVVSDGVNGVLAPPSDSEEPTLALERLLMKKDRLERLRLAAHRHAQDYSLAAVAGRMLGLYRGGLVSKGTTP